MKKILSIIIAIVFVVSMTAIAVSAQSYNPNGVCDIKFTAKHADPAAVIKDGIIGENEYEKLDVDLDPDSASLTLVFGNNAAMYTSAEEMMATMEYYFSWDEVHGFNFAVKCTPPEFSQSIPQGTGDKPGDEFLCNLGLQVNFGSNVYGDGDIPTFYYAVSKNAATGEYYEGHYQQLGLTGAYDPAPGTDYEVAFGADGSVTYEWSVALNNFTTAPTAAGTTVYFTLDALAGTDTPDDLFQNCYGVSLGDFGFMVAQAGDHSQVTAVLSDEQIGGTTPTGGDDTTTPGTNPGGDDTTPGTTPGTDPVDSNNPGATDPVNPADPTNPTDPSNPSNPSGPSNPTNPSNPSNGGKAPSTADPIVIMAIASAVSACGFMISKKRK